MSLRRTMWKYLAGFAFLAAPLQAQEVISAPGAVLRALDKTSGDAVDIDLSVGQMRQMGNLQIIMKDCRYPAGNPSGNAYALLEIAETGKDDLLFSGWMIASAPALSAMEHRRYDVWVIRCTTS